MAQILAEARAAAPPAFAPSPLPPDLVDVAKMDPSLSMAISYATCENFIGVAVYASPRAFLQRPVAAALARANRRLRGEGYALRVRDAYRPWWVTLAFWSATATAQRMFVADPEKGSAHNRGGAVDVDLVDLATGEPAAMPSSYDEMSSRSFSDYSGGDAASRRHRDLLRVAMHAESFTVLPEEWWHFDHTSSNSYPILNVSFDAIGDNRDADAT